MPALYARLNGDLVVELISIADDQDIENCYTPELVATLVPCDGETREGMTWDGSIFTVPSPPQPTPDDLLRGKLAEGIVITSSGTAAFSGTYSIDAQSQIQITGVLALLGVGQGLPNDAATIPWPDVFGAPHMFTAVAFQDFAAAISNYVFGLRTTWAVLKQGGDMPWPEQPSTIP